MQGAHGHRLDERGAILIQVAVSLLMLMGFTVFVCDYGVVWVSRGQAQNAADAGALAGVVARAYDEFASPPAAGGAVETAATMVAQQNRVWGQPGTVVIPPPVPCPASAGGGAMCVRVDVYRNGQNGSAALPVFFAPILNVASQGVRATATAQAAPAFGTTCLKPWAVADRWNEVNAPPWVQSSIYDSALGDVYTAPYTPGGPGFSKTDATGNPVDLGYQLALKFHPTAPPPLSGGWTVPIELPSGGGGGGYANNMSGCPSVSLGVAPESETCSSVNPSAGCFRVLVEAEATTRTGALDMVATDGSAVWDRTSNRPTNSAFTGLSPRVVAVAVFDSDKGVAGPALKMVNILGFFVEGMCDDPLYFHELYLDCSGSSTVVVGRLMSFPGTVVPGSGVTNGPNAFGVIARLVR